MTARRPWTIDVLDESTRDAAAAAARRSGLSLGAWLNAIVTDKVVAPYTRGPEQRDRPLRRPGGSRDLHHARSEDVSALFDALADLAERVQLAEEEARTALKVAEERLTEASLAPRGRVTQLAAAERQLEAAQADLFAAEEDSRRTYRRVAEHARDLAASSRFADDPRIDAITSAVTQLGQRLEDVARRLEAQSRTPLGEPRKNEPDLLDTIRRRLDAVAERLETPRDERFEAALKSLEARVADLSGRIETLPAQPVSIDPDRDAALARIEGQLSNLSSSVRARKASDARPATFNDQLEWDRDAATADNDLADAIRQIAARQKVLEEQFAPEVVAQTIDARFQSLSDTIAARLDTSPETPALEALRAQIRSLSEQLAQSPRSSGDHEQLAHIQRQILTLHTTIESAVSKTSLAAVIEEVKALGEKVEKLRRAGTQSEDLARIEAEMRDIRRAVESAVPRESLAAIEARIADIASRLEGQSGHLDDTALARIEREIAQLQRSVADAMPTDAFRTLVAEVRHLGQAIEGISAKTDVAAIEALRHDIVELRNQLHAPDFSQRLAADIRAQIGEAPLSGRPAQDAVAAIERQIETLAGRIESARARDIGAQQLSALEAQVARLAEGLGETRRDTIDAVRAALGEKVEIGEPAHETIIRTLQQSLVDLKSSTDASERRAQDMLLAVHDTLKKVVERLSEIEGERAPTTARSGASKPAAPLPRVEAAAFPGREAPSQTSSAPPGAKSAIEAARAAAARAAQLKSSPDDRLAMDAPLEPGSGRPTKGASTAETIRAAREQIKSAEIRAEQKTGTEVRQSFIAAARRAAQAAASSMATRQVDAKGSPPAPAADESAGAEAEHRASFLSRMTGRLKPQRKHLVLTMAAIAVVIAALQVASLFQQSPEAQPPAAPPAAVSAAPPGNTDATLLQPSTARGTFIAPTAAPQEVTTFSTAASPPAEATATAAPAGLPALPDGINSQRLRTAVQAGDPRAFFEVGARLMEGRGVARDLPAALAWYRAGAERGHPPSLYRLANMIERGQGMQRDVREAVRLYQRAANAGNRKAMHNLAALFASGAEGRPDYDRAFSLFLQAAELGLVDSQYNLAVLYVNGLGTRPNPAEAYTWFAIAAQNGDREAVAKRDEMGARLDGQALVNARLAAQSFRPRAIEPAANEESAPAGTWEDAGARTSQTPPARPDLGIQVGASTQRRG
jgi:localization factor PodJL